MKPISSGSSTFAFQATSSTSRRSSSRSCSAARRTAFRGAISALNVPVALTEALSNAILRGNHDDTARSVHVRADVDASRLVLEVRDEGTGFDLDACTEDPTTPENLLREDGRGLFLMRRLMDHVERFSDGGNVVRLILHRA